MTRVHFIHFVIGLSILAASPTVAYAEESGEGGATPVSCDPGAATEEAKDPCYKGILAECQRGGRAAGIQACEMTKAGIKDSSTMVGNFNGSGAGMTSGGAAYKAAAEKCSGMITKCDELCSQAKTGRSDSHEKCTNAMRAIQETFAKSGTTFTTQGADLLGKGASVGSDNPKDQASNPTSTTGGDKTPTKDADKGGGMGSLSGMAAPAAMIGAAVMAKMAADDKNKDDEAAAVASNSALQPNGTLTCDKGDSGLWAKCNPYLEAACTQAIQNNTFSVSPTCTGFATRYCTGGDGSPELPDATLSAAALGSAPVAATAMPTLGVQGAGRTTKFCANAIAYNYCSSGAYPSCPKCQGLQNLTSLACQTNPASCMAQSSDATLSAAASLCPGYPEPLTSSAAPLVAGSVPAAGTTAGADATLGALTLPAPNVISGIQAASIRGVASTSIIGATPGTSVGPASDIGGEFGPSLSNITAGAIAKRCQVDHLNNCP